MGSNANNLEINSSNLEVNPGETLTLLGGNINLDDAKLNAPNGRISIGSILDTTEVQLDSTLGLTNIPESALRGDVSLEDKSEVTVTNNSGGIEITAGNLSLNSGSRIESLITEPGTAGDITINANETVTITGFSEDGLFSGILSHSQGDNGGVGGKIIFNQNNNLLGNVTISEKGFIATITDSNSDSGSVELNVQNLNLLDGGQILSLTRGSGNSGEIIVNAEERVFIAGSNNIFNQSPFTGERVFSLDELEFTTAANENIESAESIPHVSIQRTEGEIVSGNVLLGEAENGSFDYYSFTITEADSRGIFDIDFGLLEDISAVGSIDTEIFLFNLATGELLATNDDSDIINGEGGSERIQDSYLTTTFTEPGTYVVGVGEFNSTANISRFEPLGGNSVDLGDTYTLQVSLENQGNLSSDSLISNPNNFNPNQGGNSGLFSVADASGNGAKITINAATLKLEEFGEISSTTFGSGKVADLEFNLRERIDLDNGSISTVTSGSGNAGNISFNAPEIMVTQTSVSASNFQAGNGGIIAINVEDNLQLISSNFSSNTSGTGNAGKITITAGGEVLLDNTNITNRINENGVGDAGGIEITATSVLLQNSADLDANLTGEGTGGNITITAAERVLLLDDGEITTLNGDITNQINNQAIGSGGNIDITTGLLRLTNSSFIRSITLSDFNAGNINITADSVELELINTDPGLIPQIITATFGNGNAGSLTLTAGTIFLSGVAEEGRTGLFSSAINGGTGAGGNTLVMADRLIIRDGAIISASNFQSRNLLPPGQGPVGSIEIEANSIMLENEGRISVAATNGDEGNISINTQNLTLNNNSLITAATEANRGGEINLNAGQLLLLRRGSNITATAGTAGSGGDGGNVTINTPIILAFPRENSNITANAFAGNGGNIEITSSGIFGLTLREEETPLSDITASSELGLSGNIAIESPDVDPTSGLVELSTEVTDSTEQVAAGCSTGANNFFVVTGRGGIPVDPTELLRGISTWSDLQNFSLELTNENSSLSSSDSRPQINSTQRIVQAIGWVIGVEGEVTLVGEASPNKYAQCNN